MSIPGASLPRHVCGQVIHPGCRNHCGIQWRQQPYQCHRLVTGVNWGNGIGCFPQGLTGSKGPLIMKHLCTIVDLIHNVSPAKMGIRFLPLPCLTQELPGWCLFSYLISYLRESVIEIECYYLKTQVFFTTSSPRWYKMYKMTHLWGFWSLWPLLPLWFLFVPLGPPFMA